ncbi:MAG: putative tetR family transcriptional regulatory protein [Gemmatimonadetes bacterium]|nr:putative tetR family transcriptional regulatory protein [Gemmatimonadota bacterium]
MTGRKKPEARRRSERTETASGPSKAAKRQLTHDDVMQASVRIDPDLRRRSQLLWDDRSQPTRGPKRGLTPDDVVQAAMQIADEEGLAAVTMSAVAARLGFTTMALYRYFPNKEALLDAIVDAGMGSPPRPKEPRGDWRAEVAQWARAKRAMLCARPWLAELPFVAAPHGPNWLSWLEAVTEPLATTGLTAADVGQMISIVDGYTRGASDTSISLARARARGTSAEEWAAAVGADLGRAIGDPRFPKFAALLTAPSDGQPRAMDESFDFGLQRVLDGIGLYVDSAKAQSAPRARAARSRPRTMR